MKFALMSKGVLQDQVPSLWPCPLFSTTKCPGSEPDSICQLESSRRFAMHDNGYLKVLVADNSSHPKVAADYSPTTL